MNQPKTFNLSLLASALACGYVTWVAYVLMTRVPALNKLLLAFGTEVPRATMITIAAANPAVAVPAAVALVIFLVAKEFFIRQYEHRLGVTLIVFIVIAWFFGFAADAMQLPLLRLIERVNG